MLQRKYPQVGVLFFLKAKRVRKEVSREEKILVRLAEEVTNLPEFAMPKGTTIVLRQEAWPCVGKSLCVLEHLNTPEAFFYVTTTRFCLPNEKPKWGNDLIPAFMICGWKVVDSLEGFPKERK